MIPKIIHLIWFGRNKYSPLCEFCINSWKEKLPDYKIMFWNEDSFDISSSRWVNEAYRQGKWAFVSDYVRLWALLKYGGVYMDTDIEVLKDFTEIINCNKYVSSFMESYLVGTPFIAAPPNNGFIRKLLEYYDKKSNEKEINFVMNPLIFTKLAIEEIGINYGQKEFFNNEFSIYKMEYFLPYRKNILRRNTLNHKNYLLTINTYTIHHDMGSWSKRTKLNKLLLGVTRLVLPNKLYQFFKVKKFKKYVNGSKSTEVRDKDD